MLVYKPVEAVSCWKHPWPVHHHPPGQLPRFPSSRSHRRHRSLPFLVRLRFTPSTYEMRADNCMVLSDMQQIISSCWLQTAAGRKIRLPSTAHPGQTMDGSAERSKCMGDAFVWHSQAKWDLRLRTPYVHGTRMAQKLNNTSLTLPLTLHLP